MWGWGAACSLSRQDSWLVPRCHGPALAWRKVTVHAFGWCWEHVHEQNPYALAQAPLDLQPLAPCKGLSASQGTSGGESYQPPSRTGLMFRLALEEVYSPEALVLCPFFFLEKVIWSLTFVRG